MITFEKSYTCPELASENGISGLLNFNTFWGSMPPDPPSDLHLRRSFSLPPHTQISSCGHGYQKRQKCIGVSMEEFKAIRTKVLYAKHAVLLAICIFCAAAHEVLDVRIPVAPVDWNAAVQTRLFVAIGEKEFVHGPRVSQVIRVASSFVELNMASLWWRTRLLRDTWRTMYTPAVEDRVATNLRLSSLHYIKKNLIALRPSKQTYAYRIQPRW